MNERLQTFVETMVPGGEIQYVRVTSEPSLLEQRDSLGNVCAIERTGRYVVTIKIDVKVAE